MTEERGGISITGSPEEEPCRAGTRSLSRGHCQAGTGGSEGAPGGQVWGCREKLETNRNS